MKNVVILFWLLLIAGCAANAKYDSGYRYPYAATGTDFHMIGLSISGKPDDAEPDAFDFLYDPVYIPLYILDVPVSLVFDTITLPYDLYHIKDVKKGERVADEMPGAEKNEKSP